MLWKIREPADDLLAEGANSETFVSSTVYTNYATATATLPTTPVTIYLEPGDTLKLTFTVAPYFKIMSMQK